MPEPSPEPAAPAQPEPASPQFYVGLDGIQVEFPDGFWQQPQHDLVHRDGRRMREHVIDQLALTIAGSLRQQLQKKYGKPSGLVGADGRPLG